MRLLCLLVLCSFAMPNWAQTTWKGSGKNGAVSAGGAAAVDAGVATLKAGGNAVDSAVTTLFAMCVTDATMFCFGGEVPILVYDAKRNVTEVIAGQGVAPRLATREHFLKKGGIPKSGIESPTVPALLDACLVALERYGTMTFTETATPMLKLLDEGNLDWHADLAKTTRRLMDAEKSAGGDRKRGLRLVADYFYRGPIAREIDAWSRQNNGLIRFSDLATHTTAIEEPMTFNYRGHVVAKCGFWTQGPYLLQTLQLLEPFNLKKLGHNQADSIHLTVEAMKLALADRDVHYADPWFAKIPAQELFESEYVRMRRELIDLKKASLEWRPGDPRLELPIMKNPPVFPGKGNADKDTTTCVVADKFGNVVSATPSGWSGVVAGPTGVWLGSRLQSFNLWENHPNCLQPGQRPRITLTPGIVFKAGKPVFAVSVAGGDGQDQAALQMIMNHIDYELSAEDSVQAPRFGTNHHIGSFGQTKPALGSLLINPEVGPKIIEELRSRGHKITEQKTGIWRPSIIVIDAKTRMFHAAGDPRGYRHAAGY